MRDLGKMHHKTLSKFDDFEINRDKAIAPGTWLKIHKNISHFQMVSLETVYILKEFYVSFFELDGS